LRSTKALSLRERPRIGESARAMVDYGHDALGFEELLAITDPDNSASIRLLSKLGFISKGVIETENEKLSLFRLELQ